MRVVPVLVCLSLLACATGEVGDPEPPVARYEEIHVSKNDVARSAVELELRAIELLPGETPEQALARAGIRLASLDEVIDEAGLADPNAGASEMAAPEAPPTAPPEGEPEAPPTEPPAAEPEAPPTAAPSVQCVDTCRWAMDGECDDAAVPGSTGACVAGTDCTDCAAQPDAPAPPAPAPEAPATDAPPSGVGEACAVDGTAGTCRNVLDCEGRAVPGHCPNSPGNVQCCVPVPPAEGACANTCRWANDGACDDGSPGAAYAVCALGTDCNDCRGMSAPMEAPAPERPAPAPEQAAPAGGAACVAGGQDGTCGPVAACAGTPVAGFCPGPADIQCCVPGAVDVERAPPGNGQGCDADGAVGICQDVATCEGTPVPGHCAGGREIQCCVPTGEVENKFACAGICIGIGVLVFRGVLYFATRSAGQAIARQAVVTTLRRTTISGARTQLTLRATEQAINAATLAAGAEQLGEVVEPNLGPAVDRFRRELAGSRADAQPNVDAESRTDACTTSPGLSACVERLHDRVRGGGGVEGERVCTDDRARDLAEQKNARCNDASTFPLSCSRNQRLEDISRRWIGQQSVDPLELDSLIEYCRFTRRKMNNRRICLEIRQRVIDECYPGDRGDHGHRCAVCMQQAGLENCVNALDQANCNDVERAFSMF